MSGVPTGRRNALPRQHLTEERATGVEPATSSLGSWHSTTELRPRTPPDARAVLPTWQPDSFELPSLTAPYPTPTIDCSFMERARAHSGSTQAAIRELFALPALLMEPIPTQEAT